MSIIIMASQSCLLSQHSLLYTKTKFPIISNYVNPSFKLLQNTLSCSNNNNNTSTFWHSLPLTTRRRRTRHSCFLSVAVDESGNDDPYENLDVFVGNVPDGIKFDTLFNLFKQVGTVVGAEIDYGEIRGQSTIYARVTLKTIDQVEKAMNKFNGYELDGKLLTVSRERPIREKPEPRPTPRIYGSDYGIRVGFLPRDFDSGRLEEIFSKHGKVESVEILYDEEFDESTGYLRMADATEIGNVIASLDSRELDVNEVYPYSLWTKE